MGNPCVTSSVVIPEFFPGCRVLARRKTDGLYYAGTVTQEVQVTAGGALHNIINNNSTNLPLLARGHSGLQGSLGGGV